MTEKNIQHNTRTKNAALRKDAFRSLPQFWGLLRLEFQLVPFFMLKTDVLVEITEELSPNLMMIHFSINKLHEKYQMAAISMNTFLGSGGHTHF